MRRIAECLAVAVAAVAATVAVGNWSAAPTAVPVFTEEYPYSAGGWTATGVDVDGAPLAWDPCRPIRWAYDPAGGPEGGLAMVSEAFDRMGELTGLVFVYAGEHDIEPAVGAARRDADGEPLPVRVSWRDASHPLLEPSHAGVAWASYDPPVPGAKNHYVTGIVVLNREFIDTKPLTFDARTDFGVVTMHEIGHVLGFGHSPERTGLMSYAPAEGSPTVDEHDHAGFRALYPGC